MLLFDACIEQKSDRGGRDEAHDELAPELKIDQKPLVKHRDDR